MGRHHVQELDAFCNRTGVEQDFGIIHVMDAGSRTSLVQTWELQGATQVSTRELRTSALEGRQPAQVTLVDQGIDLGAVATRLRTMEQAGVVEIHRR